MAEYAKLEVVATLLDSKEAETPIWEHRFVMDYATNGSVFLEVTAESTEKRFVNQNHQLMSGFVVKNMAPLDSGAKITVETQDTAFVSMLQRVDPGGIVIAASARFVDVQATGTDDALTRISAFHDD